MFRDLALQVPLRLFEILQLLPLIGRAGDVFDDVTEVESKIPGFDDFDYFDVAEAIVGRFRDDCFRQVYFLKRYSPCRRYLQSQPV